MPETLRVMIEQGKKGKPAGAWQLEGKDLTGQNGQARRHGARTSGAWHGTMAYLT